MILDTSFLIDLMENDDGAAARKRNLDGSSEICRTSAATIFELWAGIFMSKKSEEEKRKVVNALSEIGVVSVSGRISEKAGELHGLLKKDGNEIGPIDAMIAATALLENETVLTRNAKHFARVKGLRIESY